MKNALLIFCLLTFACLSAAAQEEPLAIGQWKSHLPYDNANWVTQSNSNIYFATESALLIVDKEDRSRQQFSKVDGLSNVGIRVIQFNREANTLLVVYENSVIDMVTPEGIVTNFDIPNFTGIIGDKEVYDIFVLDERFVLLAGNYGLSKMDLKNNQFAFSTFTGIPINEVAIFQGYIYAASDEGLYRIAESNNFPEDFNEWELLDQGEGFPGDYSCRTLTPYEGALFLSLNDTLMQYDGNTLSAIHYEEDLELRYLTAEGERLIAGFYCDGCTGKVLYFDTNLDFEQAPSCISRPLYAVEDQNGTVWFADGFRNFRYHFKGETDCNWIFVNSPYSTNVFDLEVYNDELWLASGGITTNYDYRELPDGFTSYIDGEWEIYNPSNSPEISNLRDFIDIAIHPENGTVYAAAFYDGLVELRGDTLKVYDDSNSSLGNAIGDALRTRVSGLAFDQNNDLWVSNHLTDNPFSVLRNDGTWKNFNLPACKENQLLQIAVDFNNYKWFVAGSPASGILVFDEGFIDDPSDDRCRLISTSNSNLPSNKVNCLAVDLEGDMWVGTDQGTIVFECGANVFDPTCTGSLRIVQQDNFGAYLLETENIQTIAVDGANRKWFGTTNGIFVQSPDGEEEIAFYNTENSPLFDNVINALAINPNDGEVFIGTNKGLQSLRGEATEGGTVHASDIKVFPNPVRPEYQGPIAIKGLARDADVKITDINGTLIYETQALGGQAIWDGRDYNGRRASTGVYLVFSTSTQTLTQPNAAVTKILFID